MIRSVRGAGFLFTQVTMPYVEDVALVGVWKNGGRTSD